MAIWPVKGVGLKYVTRDVIRYAAARTDEGRRTVR